MSGGQLNFSPSGPLTISSNIVSDNGANGGSTAAGGIAMSGTSSLTLSGANTFYRDHIADGRHSHH